MYNPCHSIQQGTKSGESTSNLQSSKEETWLATEGKKKTAKDHFTPLHDPPLHHRDNEREPLVFTGRLAGKQRHP